MRRPKVPEENIELITLDELARRLGRDKRNINFEALQHCYVGEIGTPLTSRSRLLLYLLTARAGKCQAVCRPCNTRLGKMRERGTRTGVIRRVV